MASKIASIAAIVTGHGEVEALPLLVRRVARDLDPEVFVDMPRPLRVHESRLRKAGELERHVELAARNADGVLVVLDCDDDCPAKEGPALLERAQAARPDRPIEVVLAHREFETWFIAAAESIAGRRGLVEPLQAPPEPEAIRGAKEWLKRHMKPGRYSEVLDQPKLASAFDMQMARQRSNSFDVFHRRVTALISRLRSSSS